MIHPQNKFKFAWEAFVLLLTIAVSIQAPIMIVFDVELRGWLVIADVFITVIFSIDIILNFFTGYEEGNSVVMDRRLVVRRYLRGWFWIDLIATIPFALIFHGITALWMGKIPRLMRLARLARLLRLLRLLRLIRIAQTMYRINSSNTVNPSILRLIFLVFWIGFAVHFIATGWIVMIGNPDNLDNFTRYIRALYWTTTTVTTIGYGDITPKTNAQTIYVIFIELTGAAMYGFIIGNIANLIANIDTAKAQYREKIEKINTFLKYRSIPADLQKNINDYYSYLWDSRRGYDENSVLKDLPVSLKTKVSLYINKEIIEKVPIFMGASDAFIREIIMNLEPVVFTPGDHIVRKGDLGYDMYFISKGSVDVVSEDEKTVYATLSSGQFFGEIALLFSSPRTATIKSREYCDLYRLNKDTFDSVLERYPDFEKQINEYAAQRRSDLFKDVPAEDREEDIPPTHNVDPGKVILPPHITDFTGTIRDAVIRLTWNSFSEATHYELIRRMGGNKWKVLESSLVENYYDDTSAPAGKEVHYRVRAINLAGPGPWSQIVKMSL